ncbi:hypothetical protein V8E53_003074 [Lactarius tabidus]
MRRNVNLKKIKSEHDGNKLRALGSFSLVRRCPITSLTPTTQRGLIPCGSAYMKPLWRITSAPIRRPTRVRMHPWQVCGREVLRNMDPRCSIERKPERKPGKNDRLTNLLSMLIAHRDTPGRPWHVSVRVCGIPKRQKLEFTRLHVAHVTASNNEPRLWVRSQTVRSTVFSVQHQSRCLRQGAAAPHPTFSLIRPLSDLFNRSLN